MIHTAHRHHEQAAALLPQIIALGTPAALFAWHLIKYGLTRPPASQEPEEKNPVDTHQGPC